MIQIDIDNIVALGFVKQDELQKFKSDLQEAFTAALVENFGSNSSKPIPTDKAIEKSLNAPGSVVYHILLNGKKVGGAVLAIDEITQRNSLEFFFIYANEHSNGLGYKAWKAIESTYPQTKVWETLTPYYEKRNIHFYVNKCGFKIVEYLNNNKINSSILNDKELPDEDFFRFEKVMEQ